MANGCVAIFSSAGRAGGWVIALVVALAAPALAVDGVIQINQARALAGGIAPGDTAGFPITIDKSASYRLTSNLQVPADTLGFFILASNVTIDLNGFTVESGGGTNINARGLFIQTSHDNLEIRNGTFRGLPGSGLVAGNTGGDGTRVIDVRAIANGSVGIFLDGLGGHLVRGCTAADNGNTGISVSEGSMIIDSVARNNGDRGFLINQGSLLVNSVARNNTDHGLFSTSAGGYRGNVFNGNGGVGNPEVSGGVNLGGNLCGTAVCP